jgi:hypothetical protein
MNDGNVPCWDFIPAYGVSLLRHSRVFLAGIQRLCFFNRGEITPTAVPQFLHSLPRHSRLRGNDGNQKVAMCFAFCANPSVKYKKIVGQQ